MKKIIMLSIAIMLSISAFSQTSSDSIYVPSASRKNNISLELGGSGFLYSLNYERFDVSKFKSTSFFPNSIIGYRVGISQLTNFSEDKLNLTRLILMINLDWGKKYWFLELGVGLAPTIEETSYVDAVINLSAKFQATKGFCLKFGTVVGRTIDKYYFNQDKSKNYYIPSISLGYSF